MQLLDTLLEAVGISTPTGRATKLNEAVQAVLARFPGSTIIAAQTGGWSYRVFYTEHYVLIQYAGQTLCFVIEEWNDNRMKRALTRDYEVITTEGMRQEKGPRVTPDIVDAYFRKTLTGYINYI